MMWVYFNSKCQGNFIRIFTFLQEFTTLRHLQEYRDERAADSPSTIHFNLTKYSFREFHRVLFLGNSNSSGHVNSVNVIS